MFLYFFPHAVTPESITAAGLDYAFPGGRASTVEVWNAAGNQNGYIATRPDSQPIDRQRYDTTKQTWKRIPNSVAWVGKWNDDVIKPSSLERPEQCDGPFITLADGRHWKIAQARKFVATGNERAYYCPLPHDLDLDEQGKWVLGRVSSAYEELSRFADAWWEAHSKVYAEGGDGFVFESLDEFCVAAIRANYFVSHAELALLRAYSVQCRRAVYSACLDLDFAKAVLEKKTDEGRSGSGSSSGPGQSVAAA